MRIVDHSSGEGRIVEVPKPVPAVDEILVKVAAAAVNAGESRVISGDFVGRFLRKRTEPLVLGWDFAGTVDALGSSVTGFKLGDDVWGHLAYSSSQTQGSYAEFITVPAKAAAIKPASVPVETAAATPTVAMTALQSLRDLGRLSQGQRALIIGAGGGVGAVATGIAKRLGAQVTAVCSSKDVERVTGLEADVIIDRKKQDPLKIEASFDVIFDTPAVYSFGACRHLLRSGGAYVTTLPDVNLITGMAQALFSTKRCYFVQVASKQADLEQIGTWLEGGMEVEIDSRHSVSSLDAALARQSDRQRVGRVVVDIENGWDE